MNKQERKPDGGLSEWIETLEDGEDSNDAELLCLLIELRRFRAGASAPPAPVKLPGELTACGLVPMRDCAFVEGWNACLAEVLRLNAIDNTAQQYEALAKEDKC